MKGFARAGALSVAIAASAISATSAAENYAGAFLSGNQLHEYCGTNKQAAIYYIVGLTDGLLHWSRVVDRKSVCLPVNVDSGQLTDVVCRALDADPVSRHNPASGLATLALMRAWPCR